MPMKVRYTVLDGEVIAEKRSGVRRLYVPDPLGSTVALLDNTQTQSDIFTYWPYGDERSRSGTTPTPFRFVGRSGYYRDSAVRTYVRARHLNVARGQWITADPAGFASGEGNLYRYARNNPVTHIDPSGRMPVLVVIIPIGLLLLIGSCLLACGVLISCFKRYNWTCQCGCQGKVPAEYATCMVKCLLNNCCVINRPGPDPAYKIACALCGTCMVAVWH